MQPHLLLQALFVALAVSAPTPQRASLPDLSELIGGGSGVPGLGSGGDRPSFPGLGSGGGSGERPTLPSFPGLGSDSGAGGSGFNLTKLRELLGNGANSGSGTGFDLDRLRELIRGGGTTGGGLPSIPSFPGSGGGSTGGAPSIPSVPSFPGTGGGSTGGGLGGFPSFGGSSTANDVTSKKACKPNVLLFARGTTEGGNVGSSVGPALIREIEKAAPGKFLFQGVDYQADIGGITGLGRAGGEIAVRQFNEAAALCPDATIHLSGYSQGAMVMHNAVRSASVNKAKIGGIVTFGDPFQKQPFTGVDASKVKIFCATGDSVCTGGFAITPAHLGYTSSGDTLKGAQFIAGLAA